MAEHEPKATRVFSRGENGEKTLPLGTVAALLVAVLSAGGAAGSGLTGSSISTEFREFRVEMRSDMKALRESLADRDKTSDRLEARVSGIEERLRAVENRAR